MKEDAFLPLLPGLQEHWLALGFGSIQSVSPLMAQRTPDGVRNAMQEIKSLYRNVQT